MKCIGKEHIIFIDVPIELCIIVLLFMLTLGRYIIIYMYMHTYAYTS